MTRSEIRQHRKNRQLIRHAPVHVVTVARQEPGKNTNCLIGAIAELRRDGADVRLSVVGDGSLVPSLKTLASGLGVADAVDFHGRLNHEEVLRVLQGSHIFCLPTDSEGFPKAVHEAMACGLPIVTTKMPVLEELLGDERGVMIDSPEPGLVANAISSLINDPNRYLELSTNACNAAAQYSLENWSEEIARMLNLAWGPLRAASEGPV